MIKYFNEIMATVKESLNSLDENQFRRLVDHCGERIGKKCAYMREICWNYELAGDGCQIFAYKYSGAWRFRNGGKR